MKRRQILQTASLSLIPLLGNSSVNKILPNNISPYFIDLENQQTVVFDKPPQKVEVRQFFAYWCPHCFDLEPTMLEWESTLPKEVKFVKNPVAFSKNQIDLNVMYFVLDTFENAKQLHIDVFKGMHVDKSIRPNSTEKELKEFMVNKLKLDSSKINQLWSSFTIKTKVQRNNKEVESYAIDSIPLIVIQGKYATSPSIVAKQLKNADRKLTYQTMLNAMNLSIPLMV